MRGKSGERRIPRRDLADFFSRNGETDKIPHLPFLFYLVLFFSRWCTHRRCSRISIVKIEIASRNVPAQPDESLKIYPKIPRPSNICADGRRIREMQRRDADPSTPGEPGHVDSAFYCWTRRPVRSSSRIERKNRLLFYLNFWEHCLSETSRRGCFHPRRTRSECRTDLGAVCTLQLSLSNLLCVSNTRCHVR